MRILLVEDDENKRNRVTKFLAEQCPDDVLKHADSLVAGLRAIKLETPDMVILDMTLPNYSEARIGGNNPMRPFGGREFLRQVRRMRIPVSVVVLTQFETFGSPPNVVDLAHLDGELKSEFTEIYLGAVYYHASQTSWANQILVARSKVANQK